MRGLGHWCLHYALPPVALFLVVIVLWQLAVELWDLPAYLVPSPGRVMQAAWEHRGQLARATALTAWGAVCGLAASFLCGLLVALVFSQSRLIQRAVFPYAIFLQTVPIVAIAPLVILWFGNGMFSVSLIAFIISVFPVMTNATAGLTAVDPHLLDLFELYGASRWQTLLKLRLPGAVPHLVVGLKIACGLSVIGSIVGETFAGPGMGRVGLGYLIQLTSGQTKTDYAFAALACSALLGVALFSAVSLVGNWIVTSRGGRPV